MDALLLIGVVYVNAEDFVFSLVNNPSVTLCMPPPLTQVRLSFGLTFSSSDLFVALLGFTAPPVELGGIYTTN